MPTVACECLTPLANSEKENACIRKCLFKIIVKCV